MLIEAIVQNEEEAIQAQNLGVDRLELVSAISEGGLTPSYGTIKRVLQSVSIPVQVMIRPHSHHFVYNKSDLRIMREDVQNVLDLGGVGIVTGILNEDHTINEKALEDLLGLSPNLDVTFHRAFDSVPSQKDAYRTLAKYRKQVKRILTSGGESDCVAGMMMLSELVELARETGGPNILPGAGLSPSNIGMIHQRVNANQYHFGKAIRIKQSFAYGFDEQALHEIKRQLRNDSI